MNIVDRTDRLSRLLRPRTIAVVGGGTWCANLIEQCRAIGFEGEIWPVHPTRAQIADTPAFPSVEDLPGAPDAAFVGVNRNATVGVVAALSARGAGGATCFASGFAEAAAELADGAELQQRLVAAAGAMPILGPNCYGLINALDGAALWPDVHGLTRCDSGVAIITQSSNISINLTMQRRALPIAYMVTAGNQAQTGMSEIGRALLADDRVTVLGLHIEGIDDLGAFIALAREARRRGKHVVALKVGASEQAQAATVSHTASIAGSDAGARALMRRLGVGLTDTPATFLETLKLLHVTGGIASGRVASMSCSGGEASLMADLGLAAGITYPPLVEAQIDGLREALGPKVALANPLDYHTYIWGNAEATKACFAAMMRAELGMGCVVLDVPDPERFDAAPWHQVIDALAEVRKTCPTPLALIASLPETMPPVIARACMARGIVPFAGMSEALAAIRTAADMAAAADAPEVWHPGTPHGDTLVTEAEAKARLGAHGLRLPLARRASGPNAAGVAAAAAQEIGFPIVLKGEGIAHKTEAGAVVLDLGDADAVARAARAMGAESFLVEEMVTGAVAELLIGVVRDPAHGFVMTLGAGGTLAEILRDTASLMLPATREEMRAALLGLRIAPVLTGYRGAAPADLEAILDAAGAVQAYVGAHCDTLTEVEINPLICTPLGAVAADALIKEGHKP